MSIDQDLEQAKERHLAGDLVGARVLYEALLAAKADGARNADIIFRLGILELQCGAPDAALHRLDQALALAPLTARYHFARGQILATLQRFADAADAYRHALTLEPASADLIFALGSALQANADYAAAIDAYTALLDLDPTHGDALNNLGNCHRQRGAFDHAESAYRRALALQAGNANALTNLGSLLQAQGRGDEATALLREAVRVAPESPSCLLNLGVALYEGRQFAEAAGLMANALELDPQFPEAAYNLANALHALGRPHDALTFYRQALELKPSHADAHNNLGNLCKALGDFPSAARAFDTAIALRPDFVAAHNNAGNLMRTRGRMDEAREHFERALAIDPRSSVTHNNLGNVFKDGGSLDEAIESYRQALACDPGNVVAHSNLAYSLTFQAEDGQIVLDECRRWSARHETPLSAGHLQHEDDLAANRRLRIGYVSADFRDHCQSLFTMPLFSHHDHGQFEIFCYSSVERPDDLTRRLASHADVWRDVRALDDEQLAQMIRADGIDILVDLTMHMADGRPLLFARKPAPVQVAWLAYPGTTGIGAIDYRLTDPRLDPPGTDNPYTERSIRLPDSFWCYDPLTGTPATNPLPALAAAPVTFGCLNNPCKLSERTLRMWAGVLQQMPHARLLLMAPNGTARARLLERLQQQGIDTRQVHFAAFRPRAEYLKTYHEIDLGLDTFPYNGHTTSLDSFWMGVPVVTRVGETCVGRGGLSQLVNLGLDELAAHSDADFVDIAVQLARDLPRLARMREGLRERMAASPLMDGARFAANLEAAYSTMWQRKSR
jgi:protein O-GlcNAc transferase